MQVSPAPQPSSFKLHKSLLLPPPCYMQARCCRLHPSPWQVHHHHHPIVQAPPQCHPASHKPAVTRHCRVTAPPRHTPLWSASPATIPSHCNMSRRNANLPHPSPAAACDATPATSDPPCASPAVMPHCHSTQAHAVPSRIQARATTPRGMRALVWVWVVSYYYCISI
jgi:hypothetical protein